MRFKVIAALVLATASFALPAWAQTSANPARTYVIVHGAWGGGWDWLTMDSLLTARGHKVHRVTLTGLGSRVHLANAQVGLETHITDVVNHVRWEKLRDVILVGHSYGGMIIMGAADQLGDRVQRMVFVDAIVAEPGESVMDIMPASFVNTVRANTRDSLIYQSGPEPDTVPRGVAQPLRTFTDGLRYDKARVVAMPATYIHTVMPTQVPDAFQRFADRARAYGWQMVQMQADHVPNRSKPRELVELLLQIR